MCVYTHHDSFFYSNSNNYVLDFLCDRSWCKEGRMTTSDNPQLGSLFNGILLKKLTIEQVKQIDQFLASLEEYGEVHLIVQRGILKYINRVESHKVGKDDHNHEGQT